MISLDSEFADFHDKITLNQTQRNRIESAVEAISKFVKNYFEVDDQDVFLQGSVATGTVTKPKDDSVEYDVDIVAVIGDYSSTPSGLMGDLQSSFEGSGVYADKIDEDDERPCIRLQYADESAAKFHVDVVPARVATEAPLEIPTRKRNWRNTAPREFVQWSLDHSDDYRKTVMILKRWRDNQNVEVSSIMLQVLVAEAVEAKTYGSFTEMIVDCFSTMQQRFGGSKTKPAIYNPVLASEDLAARWEDEDFGNFIEKLDEASEAASAAYEEDDKEAAVALWQKVLGSAFTSTTDTSNAVVLSTSQITLTLGDTSHAQVAPWRQVERPYMANINATATWSKEKKIFKPRARYTHWQTITMRATTRIVSGQNLNKGLVLDYYLNTNAPKPYTIHWQVVNTGTAASGDLRGEIVERSGHHVVEHTKYTGTHYVEAYIVSQGVCIARTEKFFININ